MRAHGGTMEGQLPNSSSRARFLRSDAFFIKGLYCSSARRGFEGLLVNLSASIHKMKLEAKDISYIVLVHRRNHKGTA
ncbi:predicted protein [Pyrenophora tritici-repentis Pt-1C-BFP]|uniref:Uncharacterized protein n=1 Tax=Pyrenophora tritici-repentis (strain Pt-1C-BFP) TaxID=426418 RepID=B2VU60_PYRTR|nr:uncharacterized protein PTRG_00984 [Pyrenophora tritici-repentis Pt-1C-BFP]EDU40422.1 predicted protein [Pyrenophora tritici-repentis Pt-1C-BFP]